MKVLFAGPSLAKDLDRLRGRSRGIVFAGPAAWGDVARATLRGATVIGLVDGRFEDTRSVWHKEILFAISSGVDVAGAASMGALRAAECAAFGMIGIGRIFSRFAHGELVDDADVAQVHAPAELGYVALSEPWVNIEPTLHNMYTAGVIDRGEFEILHGNARDLPFKQRTYPNILKPLDPTPERIEELLGWLCNNAVDQKRLDALELVDWLAAHQHGHRPKLDWVFSETSHWRALCDELLLEDLLPSRAQRLDAISPNDGMPQAAVDSRSQPEESHHTTAHRY
jgi:hypothetical protein